MYWSEITEEDHLLKQLLTRTVATNGIDKILESENIDNSYYLRYNIHFAGFYSKNNQNKENINKFWTR